MQVQKIHPWSKKIIDRFKTVEEIDIGVFHLSNLDSDNYEKIRAEFFKLFEFNPIPVIFLVKDTVKNLIIYRARPLMKIMTNESISDVNTFSCPPWNKDNGLGRANWSARNVFYGSDSPYAAINETSKEYKEGDEFYIAKWRFDLNKLTPDKIQISTLVFDNIPPENPWNFIVHNSKKFEDQLKKEMGQQSSQKFIYLIKKLSKLFVELDNTKYQITAFIADQIIYFDYHRKNFSQNHFPILLYPSVATNNENCNFAIHPFFVQQYMKLESVFHIKLHQTNTKSLNHIIEKVGFCSNKNTVNWYEINIDFSEAVYKIESLNCHSCKKPIKLNNLDEIIFKKNNTVINIHKIIVDFIEERDSSEFYNLDNIIEKDGLLIANEVKFSSVPLNQITAKINNEKHSNLTLDLIVKQPITYKKINSI